MTKFCSCLRRHVLYRVITFGLTALLLACSSPTGDAPAPATSTWLARSGDQVVEMEEFQAYLEQQTHRNPRLKITPAMKRDLLEKCLEKKLLLAEADRQNLEQDPKVIKDVKEMKEQIMIKHLFAHKEKELAGQIKIGNEEIQQYYQDMSQVLQFRYIIVDDPTQANAVVNKWAQKISASEAVDSGEVSLATLDESWSRHLLKLPPHKPQTIKIGRHWFVVEVVNKRKVEVLPLDQVREQIVGNLSSRKEKETLQNWLHSLKGQHRLEINEAHNWH